MTERNDDPPAPSAAPSRAVRALRQLARLVSDRPYRGMMWLYWRQPPGAFQPFNDTAPDRYPAIFRFVQEQLGARSELRLLSFGCSTGEEVFSLRHYFPRAAIKGIDINAGNIAAARRRLARSPDPFVSFETGRSSAGEAAASYDAIFCMATLRHGSLGQPGIRRCDHLLRFADFAATIADFSRCLKRGGLLVVRHSNFRFCDTPASAAFETILRVPIKEENRTPLFGPDNMLLGDADYPDTVFRKVRHWHHAARRPDKAGGGKR